MTRPAGVVSKNRMGARSTRESSDSCMNVEPRSATVTMPSCLIRNRVVERRPMHVYTPT